MDNQYSRRENIELLGIDEKIQQKDLEAYVLEILKSIKINISSYNIVAVHRLGRKRRGFNRNVIVRFVNRKNAILALKFKKNLSKTKFKDVKIIENLCPANKKIYKKCSALKRQNFLSSVWTFNGVVNIKFTDSEDEYPTKVYHFDDIEYHLNYVSESESD